ncbi:MAG: hypothetical protein P4L26_16530 [Terracidiphilus sp.]|nr:hypothetical protein [Terracidiphilus sp.]
MRRSILLCAAAFFAGAWALVPGAVALPSYARQTGLPCSGCHTTPPELNNGGRLFKLLGYTDRAQNTSITAEGNTRRSPLNLLQSFPLSVFLETSITGTKTPQPATQNWNAEFPQDVSLFLAGAWASHVGSFLQITYDPQGDHFSMDNTDIRYANKTKMGGKEFDFGVTMNNNPTLEDLWNATPAWGYPFIANDSAPGPTASPVINGQLATDVAGLGGYAMWDQHVYVAGTLYRSDHIGDTQPTTGLCCSYNVRGVAPYWRMAFQQTGQTGNLEVGAYGLHMKSTPGGVTGAEDSYTDFGPDIDYERTLGKDVLSVRASYVRENADLVASTANGAASPGPHHLNASNANVGYHFGNRFSGTLGWFLTDGTNDPLLYAPASISGSANGGARSEGFITNVSYWPWQNIDLAAQYTNYTRFNGGATNYDGSLRNASDNNTLYLLARFVF